MIRIRKLALAAFLLLLAPCASADEFPSHPLKIVVPYSAGGGADALARLVATHLSGRLKQTVVVENQGGGSNTIGMRTVVTSPKDGYTLGLATPVFVMTPSLMKDQPYDPLKDFTPVAMIGFTPMVLCVNPSVAAKDVKEFIALAKSKPGALNFASLGPATTQGLSATMFNQMAGIDAVQVAYKGSAPGTLDLISGTVQYMFNALPSMLKQIEAGRLRALGVSSRDRAAQLPNVAPIREVLPGYEVTTWYSFVAPTGTPDAAVRLLNREINAVLALPDVRQQLAHQGVEPDAMSPAELGKLYAAESAKWAKVIKDAKITPE
ncbi:MAG TPA: tripartite tricarboxylate transporter substrate binding protein [Usitatibacter sp.]|nr:tripartite tricarboxylate transporter substrate binding protein [Usitatibacter sp.]